MSFKGGKKPPALPPEPPKEPEGKHKPHLMIIIDVGKPKGFRGAKKNQPKPKE